MACRPPSSADKETSVLGAVLAKKEVSAARVVTERERGMSGRTVTPLSRSSDGRERLRATSTSAPALTGAR